MKIGYVSRWDPRDKRAWSGITYSTYTQVSKRYETEIFTLSWPWYLRERLTMQKSINRRLFGKHTVVEFLNRYARYFSKQLQSELKKRPVDLLFTLASSQYISYLETDIPIVYMTDATFQQIRDYYPYFSNLPKYNIREGIELDKSAFHRASHCMLTSEWSKKSAINDYGVDPRRISVVHMGPNLDRIPTTSELSLRKPGLCRLLFLGVEWERKGGDIALQAYHILKQKGLNPTLHIIGCVPPDNSPVDSGITVIPFLDKNKTEDFNRLYQILLDTDFLLLPTKAECSGIVFSEAAAFGFPSITYDTGGLGDYVVNGVNGYRLPQQSTAQEFAEKIEMICSDKALYQHLSSDNRLLFENKLNWDVWGEKFKQIVTQLA